MPHDFLPRPDADFSAWLTQYNDAVHAYWAAKGLNPSDLKPFEDALSNWNKDYPAHIAARARAEAAAAAKRDARYGIEGAPAGKLGGLAGVEAEVRRLATFIQSYPTTTDADRARMGLRVHLPTRAASTAPTTAPVARVESANRLTHTVRFSDESTPTRRGKPKGVQGAEVWLALADAHAPPPPLSTDPRTGEAGYRFLALSSRGNLHTSFTSEDKAKTAYYALRWVSTRGEPGPWSEVAAATVAA